MAAPSHRAFLVENPSDANDDPNAKARWREVAAAWQHKDGKGMDLFIPAGMALTGRVVIRVNEPQAPEQTARTSAPAYRR